MFHIIEHTLLDTILLIPFLFLAFLLMEFLEHKMNKSNKNKIKMAEKLIYSFRLDEVIEVVAGEVKSKVDESKGQ